MNTLLKFLKCCALAALFLGTSSAVSAQSWLELREQGANFYDIKAAFMRQYGNKLPEMNRELRREVKEGGMKSGKYEKNMEGMIQYMRWANFVEPRVMESNGNLNAMNQGVVQAIADQNRRASTRTGANWTVIGPRNTPTDGGNGRINAVRAHPSVAGTLFACAPAGGLWRTTDSGTNWTPISDAIAVLGATDVAFDPTNPSIMYLATGDGEAGDTYSTGIYKSTDGGFSWAATGLTFTTSQSKTLSKLLVNPTDGSILAGGGVGIYRSTNGGTSWTQVSTTAVRDLEFKPTDPTVVYAGGYGGTTAFLKSTNSGLTWAAAGTGLPTTTWRRVALAVTPLDNTYIYALVGNTTDDGFKGLYLSTDGGTTFTLKSAAATPSTTTPNILGWDANGADAGGQGWYDLSIVVDPSVKTTIYTGGVNMWKSTNSGTSWTIMTHWSGSGAPYVHADCHDLTVVGTTIYAGNDGGVFSSANGGTWTDRSGNLSIGQLYGIGTSQTNANLIIAGHQDNGTTLTSNLSTWSEVNGGDGMLCFIDRADNTRMFSSIYNGALYRSTNSGGSFSSIYTVSGGGWVTPWLQDPVTATTLYAGGTNVVRSINSGTAWTTISSFSIGTLVSLDVATTNNQHIIAASGTAIMRTTNGGTAWTNITTGLPSGVAIQSVYFDPLDALKIYVGLASYTGQSVYYSANGGTSWTNISSGLPSVPVSCFVVQNNNGDLYCGTDIGVYLRASGSTTWTPFTSGMPGIQVKDLEIHAASGKLRAATFARGIWESTVNSNNNPPLVAITLPVNNAIFSVGSNVVINATATDADGTVTKVEFYQGTTLLSTSTTAPYTYTWATPPVGSYVLTAKAYDNLNAIGTSAAVNITVAVADDAGISAITTPNGTVSLPTATPSVTLKNFGTTILTTTTISYKVDNGAFTDYSWTGSLASGATATVTLPSITGYAVGAHTFTAKTGSVNGNIDANTANDALTVNFTYTIPAACTNAVTSPYSQNFNAATTIPTGWTNTTTWGIAANHANGVGNGIYKNIYSTVATAQFTMIGVGPIQANDQLSFDYRLLNYATVANYPTNTTVTAAGWGNIQVQISTDCGVTYTTFYTINDANHVVTKNWATKNIPLSTYAGQTVIFRIIANWTTGDWYVDMDNFNIAIPCSGTPTAGTAAISTPTSCAGSTVTLSATGTSTSVGVAFQWQKSTDNGGTWADIVGATAISSAVVVSGAAQYKLVSTCTNGNASIASNAVSLTVATPVYATVPYSQDFEAWSTSACVSGATTKDVPSTNWQNTPTTGVNSWRRNDEGVTTGGWANLTGAYSPLAQSGTYSARFHSYNTTLKGQLDLFVNLSGSASKNLSFYYVNTSGADSLKVWLSTDAGLTFTQVGATLKLSAAWALQSFPLPAATATSVIRLEAGGDNGSTDIGLDNLNITELTAAPVCATQTSPTNNSVGLCPTGIVLQWAAAANATSYDIYTNLPNVTSPINVVGTSYTILGALPLSTNYTWQVVPKNSIGSATGCTTWNFTTGATPCYCTPTYVDGCANGLDVITRLQLGTLDNTSANACGTGNYNFYSSATIPDLPQSVPQSMTVVFGNDADQFMGAWIDYNQNGTFDAATEFLGGNAVTAGANGTYVLTFTVPTTALTGQTRLRVRGGEDFALTSAQACGASSDTYGQTEDYTVNILATTACAGTLAPNATVSNTSTACMGELVSLSLKNTYALTGITYQWQSAPNVLLWTDISGATNATTLQTMAAATYYRCVIACSGGAPIYSAPVNIALKSYANCYCTPVAACSASYINNVSVATTTLSNSASGCSNAAGSPSSYTLYPASGATTATLLKGTAYTLSVATNVAQIVSVWIDYNQNGAFETTEWAQVSLSTTANVATTLSMTIPTTATTGMAVMRIRSRSAGNANAGGDACSTFASGETEDYWVNIQPAVIPVELKTITAYAQEGVNKIDWVTASEKTLKAFVVERSSDNLNWLTIGTTAPKGGTKETFYSLTDEKPMLLGYYRLRSVDLNGDEQISKIVSVKRYDSKKFVVLNVSPVPTTEGVTVDFSVSKEATITLTLTNIVGQVLKTDVVKASEGTNKTVVNLSNLPNGTYFLTVSDGDKTELKRVVKQ